MSAVRRILRWLWWVGTGWLAVASLPGIARYLRMRAISAPPPPGAAGGPPRGPH